MHRNKPQPTESGTNPSGEKLTEQSPYLFWAFVKHFPCPGELVGVGGVLDPHAGGTGAHGRQVPAHRLLGHLVGQAGAARARGWRGPSEGQNRGQALSIAAREICCALCSFHFASFSQDLCSAVVPPLQKHHSSHVPSKGQTHPKPRVNSVPTPG